MADFFVVVELIKYFDLDNDILVNTNSFVYAAKLRTETILDSYFTTLYGTIDNTEKETLNIKGLIVNITNFYSLQTSIIDCEDNEESFYFDITNQVLYIHLNHLLNPYNCSIEIGKVFGFTNDKVRNFNGIDYLPLVKSIPNFALKVDPLSYTQQSFYGGDVVFNNTPIDGSNNGLFDSNREFTGNDIFILFGEDGDDYTDLILIANNFIVNTIISMEEIIVFTKDKREQQSVFVPQDTFEFADFPFIDDDLITSIKPDAYGPLNAVPGICVNSENAGNKKFYFASIIQAAPAPIFKAKDEGIWGVITPTVTDYPNGIATFAVADIHVDGDNTKGILDVKCDGTFRPSTNPGDIIADLNDRFLLVDYNASNYNTSEWEDEKQYLEDVGLYMDDEKEMYEWIELLQNGSTVGFQYLFIYGKRTMRLDNPNRTPVRTIYPVEIINDYKFDNNEQFYSTHAVIFYDKNQTTNKKKRFKNNDYFLEVMAQHRKSQQYETECLMDSLSGAIDKSVIIMEDQKVERPIGRLVFHGKTYFELLSFDIINAEISNPGIKIGKETLDVYVFGDDDDDDVYVFGDGNDAVYVFHDYTVRDIIINAREFLGENRYQIIGLYPDFINGNIEVEVRQRDYSTLYDSITGYPIS